MYREHHERLKNVLEDADRQAESIAARLNLQKELLPRVVYQKGRYASAVLNILERRLNNYGPANT